MVGARPDVDEDQRPEVDDGKFVGKYRAVGGFRQEVVHQPQVGRGEEESHRIVAVPPLYERILHPGKDRVAQRPGHRHFAAAYDVQYGHRDPSGNIKPDGDVQVAFPPLQNSAEHIDPENDPDHRDEQVDGPDQFAVFAAGGQAHRQGVGGAEDDHLPAIKMDPGEFVAPHPGFQQALEGVVHAHENAVAHEGENDRVGMQRAQSPEREPGFEVERWKHHLEGHDQPHQHAHRAPEERGHAKGAGDLVVVLELLEVGRNVAVGVIPKQQRIGVVLKAAYIAHKAGGGSSSCCFFIASRSSGEGLGTGLSKSMRMAGV